MNEEFNTKEIEVPAAKQSADDEFVIGAGFKVDEEADIVQQPAGPQKHKHETAVKKGVASAIIRIIVIICVSFLLAGSFIFVASDYLGIGINRGKEVVVDIPQGTSVKAIAKKLKDVDAINSTLLFRAYTKLKGYDNSYQYGVYTFNNEAGYSELSRILQTEGAVAESVEVTIPEQASIDDIIKLLSEKGVCTKADFIDVMENNEYEYDLVKDIPKSEVYYRFEGYLFPDTYDFYCYDSRECAELAIRKMLERTDKLLTSEMRAHIKETGRTIHETLTMASLLELEASGNPEEMANVAQVFYNRLKDWDVPLLGSSPTAKYAHGNGRYDTNKQQGLPPGPYCCPSEAAIKAAVYPNADVTATYFVTDAKMKFYYTNSLAEHNKVIAKLKAEKNWIYE